MPSEERAEETPMQEVRRLGRIQMHYSKLSDAGKEYIRKWMGNRGRSE